MSANFVFLASGSPRRRELLRQIGVPFRVIGAAVDESVLAGEQAADYVSRLAAAKAQAGWQSRQAASPAEAAAPVLAADTAVILEDRILGKPSGRQQAEEMLLSLSGRTHQVLTAVALRSASGLDARLSHSSVTFRTLRPAEAAAYWDTGESRDKAGAYAIQGAAAVFIAELRGSYSGVMGLPLFETAELLQAAGVAHWQTDLPA
jgi:septum formation protein